jgi:diketogulonate reductase-like aldo/keto reductase
VPLAETVAAMEELKGAGKIRHWGVSNLDADDMAELAEVPGGGAAATDQVLYNLTRRGVEWDLLPWCRRHGIPAMAYSPVEQGRLLGRPALRRVAVRHGATPAQVALAWLLRQDGIVAIPKAGTAAHVEENRGALALRLGEDDIAELDRAFPPPAAPRPLEML